MSSYIAVLRRIVLWITVACTAVLVACADAPQDPGKQRSEAESQTLRDRINTTQVDR